MFLTSLVPLLVPSLLFFPVHVAHRVLLTALPRSGDRGRTLRVGVGCVGVGVLRRLGMESEVTQVLSQKETVTSGQGSFGVHVPESVSLRPVDYELTVSVQPKSARCRCF